MTMTLGELINKLEQQPKDNWITFDFGNLVPTDFDSWRGIYAELALGYEEMNFDNNDTRVYEILDKAREAVGETYYGWKGGEYTMSLDSEVWIDNRGRCTNTALIDVIQDNHKTILVTQYNGY